MILLLKMNSTYNVNISDDCWDRLEHLQKDISDWDKLTATQKEGILDAIDEVESDKGIPNKVVLDKFRKKYSHA